MTSLPPDYLTARKAEALDILASRDAMPSLKLTAWLALKNFRRAQMIDATPCDTGENR